MQQRLDIIQQGVGVLIDAVNVVQKENVKMAGELDDLKANVTANTGVVQSAVVLLQGLKAALDSAIASGDPAQLKALSDQLGSDTQNLAAAVAANTPAGP